ncbi:Nst1, partial [Ophiophagus hannah]
MEWSRAMMVNLLHLCQSHRPNSALPHMPTHASHWTAGLQVSATHALGVGHMHAHCILGMHTRFRHSVPKRLAITGLAETCTDREEKEEVVVVEEEEEKTDMRRRRKKEEGRRKRGGGGGEEKRRRREEEEEEETDMKEKEGRRRKKEGRKKEGGEEEKTKKR